MLSKKIIDYFQQNKNKYITSNEIAEFFSENKKKINVYLWRLKNKGKIKAIGKIGGSIQYVLTDSIFEKIDKLKLGFNEYNNFFKSIIEDQNIDPKFKKKLLEFGKDKLNIELLKKIEGDNT